MSIFNNFKLVHLIGSTKQNKEKFIEAEKELTNQGYIVFKPVLYGDEVNNDNLQMLTDMCSEKLQVCDIVCLVTLEHVGQSTIKRLVQARNMNKILMIYKNKEMKPLSVNSNIGGTNND